LDGNLTFDTRRIKQVIPKLNDYITTIGWKKLNFNGLRNILNILIQIYLNMRLKINT